MHSISSNNDVSFLDSATFCGRAAADTGDKGAFHPRRWCSDCQRRILYRDTDVSTPNAAMLNDLLHDSARHVDRHRKTNHDIAACGREDGGVDTDQLTTKVDERAARVAGVDGRVSLDEVHVALLSETSATEGAHKARGHGLPKPTRIADSDDEVTNFEPIAVAHRNCLDSLSVLQAEDGQVGARVPTDELGNEAASVLRGHLRGRDFRNNVVGGEHVAILRINDYARANRLDFLFGSVRPIEELAKARIAVERIVPFDASVDRDVDDAWRDFAHERG